MPATQEPKDSQISASDNPELIQAAKCALPLIFTLLEHPESPSTRGTCTALRAGDLTFFVLAAIRALPASTRRPTSGSPSTT